MHGSVRNAVHTMTGMSMLQAISGMRVCVLCTACSDRNIEKTVGKILDSFEMNGKNSRNGLGLAICKNMVTLLNGEINVSSIQNEITTFTAVSYTHLPNEIRSS